MSYQEAEIQKLLDERAITRVLHAYCRAVDRLDEDLLVSTYHPDSYDDHGVFKGNGQEFARFCIKALKERTLATSHRMSNIMIDLEGRDARSESYVIARHLVESDGVQKLETAGARYIDQFSQREGQWKIASRVVVVDWGKVEDINQLFPGFDRYNQGTRWPDDLVYDKDR